MEKLTLQIYLEQAWCDLAFLYFDSETYQLCNFEYLTDYVVQHYGKTGEHAVSLNYPVNVFIDDTTSLWSWLSDIAPAGASRRYWLEALDIKQESEEKQQFLLLKHAAISPIGNLRIKDAVPEQVEVRLFDLDKAKDRQSDFLEYVNQSGAMVGGATGAGGEAPKLLLKRRENQVWIDNQQQGQDQDVSYLVKYPRGNYSPIDCDILRAEYHYYQELAQLGFDTIDTTRMRLEEGKRYPSLWLPRFDIVQREGKTHRLAFESVYSLLQKQGGVLDHETTLRQLIERISTARLQFAQTDFVIEWVKRDLLNIAFGNSDNHGRNMAFLRDEQRIWLAPIYDFAPMRADPEGIIRTTTWQTKGEYPQEFAGEYHFARIAEVLADLVEPTLLMQELRRLAGSLVDLKSRLVQRNLPQSILDFPAIGFDYLPEKLKKWGLI
ncbi:type II toxin-antitoxin system HipA family toxin [Pasteurella multocida]|uniref:type II toxin-antitoxin system HipA family toxin n=1 Tax=Pasteurella multocida TaxID=747 RepID=UPI001896D996|nr:HipA domain-containing protein [Pasteurella multocida]MBF6984061.1 HipA domain-containing protein [Pasteurella multocida]